MFAISLVNLEVLELRDNLIRFLPVSLGSLTRLQSLDLGSNLIDVLVGHLFFHVKYSIFI